MPSPSGEVGGEVAGEDVPASTKRVRCESCRSVVWTRHAWDRATCACGRVTLAGRPRAPRITWSALPGAGWSDVPASDDDPVDEPSEPEPPRTIGYLRNA